MLTDDMGKITKKYETNSGHILSAALTVVIIKKREEGRGRGEGGEEGRGEGERIEVD